MQVNLNFLMHLTVHYIAYKVIVFILNDEQVQHLETVIFKVINDFMNIKEALEVSDNEDNLGVQIDD